VREQARFWFVHAKAGSGESACLAVAAFTERSAKAQARKAMGPGWTFEATAVYYAHVWEIRFGRLRLPVTEKQP
jgi:hypothetical protein